MSCRGPDGVLAEMRLLLTGSPEPQQLAQTLEAALQPGLLGHLRVKPASLTVQASNALENNVRQATIPGPALGEDTGEAKLYAVAGAVAALVFLLVVQAIAMACRRRLRPQAPTNRQEKLLASSHWKDYSTTASSNYSYENFALRAEDDLGPPVGAPRAVSERSTAGSRAQQYPATQRHHPQELNPDFYFMPHQRRYSGEVVRVFVDYSNPEYTGAAR